MATTTGIRGGTTLNQPSGLEKLTSLKQDKAQALLTELRANLNNRTGVVRLLHTSKTDKEMTFKTAGGFKQIFLNGGKLQRSGEVIRDLLRQAGANEGQVSNFDNYVRSRGRSGVEASRVKQEIAKLNLQAHGAVVAATVPEALRAFGLPAIGISMAGEGAHARVIGFVHDGIDMVYKRPHEYDGDNPIYQLQLQVDSPGVLLKPLQGNLNDASAPVTDFEKRFREELGKPDFKLSRRQGMAIAARVNPYQIPEAVAPSVYVIKETQLDGQTRYHAVGGGEGLKIWAKQQPGDAALQIVGLVMFRAAGVQPLETTQGDQELQITKANVASTDLKPMALSGLRGLQKFSRHGFIHGDYKPENMIWDTKTKTLRVIDLDGMKKISSKPGSKIPYDLLAKNDKYMHPMKINPLASVGVGQDLFAFGLTLLETAVHAGGDSLTIEQFRDLQTFLTGVDGKFLAHSSKGRSEIINRLEQESQGLPGDSVQHFALQAIRTAIEYEGNRLSQGQKSYDRWSPGDDSHPLNQLAKHPAIG